MFLSNHRIIFKKVQESSTYSARSASKLNILARIWGCYDPHPEHLKVMSSLKLHITGRTMGIRVMEIVVAGEGGSYGPTISCGLELN